MNLPKGDECAIVGFPVLSWQLFSQLHFGFKGRFCFYVAEPVADAVHVDVDAYGVLIKRFCHYDIGCFPAHARELDELIKCAWHAIF